VYPTPIYNTTTPMTYQPGPAIAAPGYGQELAWPFTTPFAAPAPMMYPQQQPAPAPMPMPIIMLPQLPSYTAATAAASAAAYGGSAAASAAAGFGGISTCGQAGCGTCGMNGYSLPPAYSPYANASAFAGPFGASAFANAGFGGGSVLDSLLGGGGFGNAFASAFSGNGNSLLSLLLSALVSRLNNQNQVISNPISGGNGVVQPTIVDPVTGAVSQPAQKLVTVDVPTGIKQNLTWGDPHFEYYDAQGNLKKYDFQGQANKWFTLVKDGSLEMNSHFKAWGNDGATVMDKLGLTMDGTQVSYDANGKPTISGRVSTDGGNTFQTLTNHTLENGKEYVFESGVPGQNGSGELAARVKWEEGSNTLDVVTGEYHFVAKKENDYIRLLSSPTAAGVFANGKGADGVLGRAFNPAFANFGKDGKQGANAQGEGFLDKAMEAYIAAGQFQGSQQLADDTVTAEWGKLAQNQNKNGEAK
jgi:hypothetical protein